MPPCPVPANLIPPDAPPSVTPMRFAPLPEQSVRTALILDRFSLGCSVLYCSNDSLLRTTAVLGPADTADITIASLVPTQLGRLLDRDPPPSLRVVMLGGAPAGDTRGNEETHA